MSRIFISYRRADSQAITDRIQEHIAGEFGAQNVFQDVFDIPYGDDFRKVLSDQVSACDILLVIIGTQWVSITDAMGQRRIDDPNDFVRIEVETGLKNPKTRVIPILVNGARPPTSGELPESLRELAYRNAIEVRNNPYFDDDIRRLSRQLGSPRRVTPAIIGAALITVLLIGALAVLASGALNSPTPTITVGASAPTVSPTAATAQAGATPTLAQEGISGRGFSVFESPDTDALIIRRVSLGEALTITDTGVEDWVQITLSDGATGWARSSDVQFIIPTTMPGGTAIAVADGFGAHGEYWDVYFTSPDGSRESAPECDDPQALLPIGIAARVADAIDRVERTLDIAVYEFNECLLTQAVLDAHARGVVVRVVTDDEFGLADEDTTLQRFVEAGIEVVTDERSAFMHNKFMILDGSVVWTGSWNFTYNDTLRNNNNTLRLTAPEVVHSYQDEFDEMFDDRSFGPRSPTSESPLPTDAPILPMFAPEDDALQAIVSVVSNAQSAIDFMAFSFTYADLGALMIAAASRGVEVRGVFETTGSTTSFSQLTPLFCAGLDVRQDGSPFVMHHKVIIVDQSVVIVGSSNFSSNAFSSNDENFVVMRDVNLAAEYMKEFERQWTAAHSPQGLTCPS